MTKQNPTSNIEKSFSGLFDDSSVSKTNPHIYIFAVDDEEKALGTLKEFCLKHKEQYDLTIEQSPLVAIERIKKEQPDVVITDWDFKQDITGIDLIKILKNNPKTEAIPVLMHTGYSTSVHDLQIALDAGATDFLTKPANFTELLARLNRIIREKEYAQKLAEQKNKLELQNSLLLTIDHDVKNYLHSMYLVINNVQNFSSELAREELQSNFNLVTSLLSNALEVQNINDSLNLNIEEIDLHAIIQACFENIASEFKHRMVTFCNEVSNVVVEADTFYLERVLHNLLHNAVKYAQGGGKGKVTASVVVDGAWVRIIIADNGQGIALQEQQDIFEFGVKDESHEGKQNRASGFGLPLSKKIVEAHQGQIKVQSNPGHGSAFEFTLKGKTKGLGQTRVVTENVFVMSSASAQKLYHTKAFQQLKATKEVSPVYNALSQLSFSETDIQEWVVLMRRYIMRKENHAMFDELLQMVETQARQNARS